MKIRIAAVCAVLVAGLAYFAATALAVVNWDGSDFAVNNNWSNASNWVGNVAPTSVDDAVFNSANFAGGWTPQVVTVIAGDEANSLAFQGALSAAVTLSTTASDYMNLWGAAPITNTATGAAVNIGGGLGGTVYLQNFTTSTISNSGTLNINDNLSFGIPWPLRAPARRRSAEVCWAAAAESPQTAAGNFCLSGPNASLFDAWTINGGKVSAGVSTAVNSLGSGAISLSGSTLDLNPTADTSASGLSGRQFASTISDTAPIDFTQTAGSTRTDATIDSNDAGVLPAGQAIQWTGKVDLSASGLPISSRSPRTTAAGCSSTASWWCRMTAPEARTRGAPRPR